MFELNRIYVFDVVEENKTEQKKKMIALLKLPAEFTTLNFIHAFVYVVLTAYAFMKMTKLSQISTFG